MKVIPFVTWFDNYCAENGIKFKATYKVDYEWGPSSVDGEKIKEIGKLNIYGQEIPESYVALIGIPLNQDNVTLMSPDKHPTLKVQLDKDGVNMIKFKSSQEEYSQWATDGQVIDVVGKCQVNEWQGQVTPQIIIEDFQIRKEWVF